MPRYQVFHHVEEYIWVTAKDEEEAEQKAADIFEKAPEKFTPKDEGFTAQ